MLFLYCFFYIIALYWYILKLICLFDYAYLMTSNVSYKSWLLFNDEQFTILFWNSFFVEKNMWTFFLRFIRQNSGYISIQLLQTLNILFENLRNVTSVCEFSYAM